MAISPVSPAISLGFSFTGRRCIFRHSDTRSTRLLAKIVVGNHKSATVVTCGGRHHVQIHDETNGSSGGDYRRRR
ncbi:hypothetical protein HanPSC8_Chr02g0061631 [Helianthus annuus]|uniref:Uncharacterized protein n=1 Tax=Helianthus annuus TaxID=4232 RepID=A0A251VGQ1_HELAN|nr:hypothetical protein HanPSC8_Chr02g0061631 [Helianthus annuus]